MKQVVGDSETFNFEALKTGQVLWLKWRKNSDDFWSTSFAFDACDWSIRFNKIANSSLHTVGGTRIICRGMESCLWVCSLSLASVGLPSNKTTLFCASHKINSNSHAKTWQEKLCTNCICVVFIRFRDSLHKEPTIIAPSTKNYQPLPTNQPHQRQPLIWMFYFWTRRQRPVKIAQSRPVWSETGTAKSTGQRFGVLAEKKQLGWHWFVGGVFLQIPHGLFSFGNFVWEKWKKTIETTHMEHNFGPIFVAWSALMSPCCSGRWFGTRPNLPAPLRTPLKVQEHLVMAFWCVWIG